MSLTPRDAVNVLVFHGQGCIQLAHDLVPRRCQHPPPARLLTLRATPR